MRLLETGAQVRVRCDQQRGVVYRSVRDKVLIVVGVRTVSAIEGNLKRCFALFVQLSPILVPLAVVIQWTGIPVQLSAVITITVFVIDNPVR